MTTEFTLTQGQQEALDAFSSFLFDPNQEVFIIQGYAGTGKSTLIRTLINELPNYTKAMQLVDPSYEPMPMLFTATTHKAAENFAHITGMPCSTVHSELGMRLSTDYASGKKSLVINRNVAPKYGHLIFVDEASMIDSNTLSLIFQQAIKCKIVFIGDPAQLPPVSKGAIRTPVFTAGFPFAALTEVMRTQVDGKPAVSPITELATGFREVATAFSQGVKEPVWPNTQPDGQYIIHMPKSDFMQAIEKEFTRSDWTYRDSKILAWTNATVIEYNKYVRGLVKGDPDLQVGDYAENNSNIQIGKDQIKTDQTVYISGIGELEEVHGVLGNYVEINDMYRVFHPKDRTQKAKAAARLRAEGKFKDALDVDNWIDLRAVFAQTVNKSQGSTYGKVFIDLNDFKRCNIYELLARLMYVSISRAQNQVIFTGSYA
jgi:hypothetical protein